MFENHSSGQINMPMCQMQLSGATMLGAVEGGNGAPPSA